MKSIKNSSQPKIKSPDRVKAKLAQICHAAIELFAEKGYHKTSVREIAKKSGVSIGSLYDYINSKEDILYFLANEFLSHLRSEVDKVLMEEEDVIKKLEGTLVTTLRVVDQFQEYTLFTYRESKSLKDADLVAVLEQEAFFTDTFAVIIREGVEQGVFESDQPEISANMLTVMTHSWALKRYNLKKFPLYSFEKNLLSFALKGLLKERPVGNPSEK